MSVNQIQAVGRGEGHRVVPALSDYADASEAWTEVEHRADVALPGAVVGYWEGEPGWVRIDDWPYTEVCLIQSGSVELVDDEGGSRVFGPGQAFVVPQGFRGTWRTVEATQKIFVGIPT